MKLEALVADGERMHQQLGREYYLTGSGLKADPDIESIYTRFQHLGSDEALDTARGSGESTLLEWVLGLRVGRKAAPLEERQLRWEQSASVTLDGHEFPYLRVSIELANSPDRPFRTALDAERNRVGAAALNPMLEERLTLEREEVIGLGMGDYVATLGALADVDLDELGRHATGFLAQTDDLYRDSLGRLVRRRLDVGIDELTRADTAWTFRADGFDAAFPPDRMLDIAVGQMREMGLDAKQGNRVRFDTDERPGKQPRAFCVPVRVPEEVYLVLRPSGGHGDYRTFWHELGHAMHFASVDPASSFASRWLGDNSVTEAFAMLWDHLTIDRAWLTRYTDLEQSDASNLVFELAVAELHMLRRYCAKLAYELVLHRSDLRGVADDYVERLSDATRFRYGPENYLIDVDPGFYSARYLRAWQLEASLAAEMISRFDVDWWRNPRAGSFVQHVMSRGQADPAHRLAREIIGRDLSFEPCVTRLEDALG